MIRIDVVYTGLQGLPGVSSLYWAGDSQAVADDAAAATVDFFEAIQANLTPLMQVDVSNIAVGVNEEDGVLFDFLPVIGTTINGTGVDEPYPIGTACVFQFKTATIVRGRRVQGRIYVPGFTEGNDSGTGVLDPGNVTGLSTIAANTLGAATGVQVVWSRPVEGGAAGSIAPVVTYGVSEVFSNLRTRRR